VAKRLIDEPDIMIFVDGAAQSFGAVEITEPQ